MTGDDPRRWFSQGAACNPNCREGEAVPVHGADLSKE